MQKMKEDWKANEEEGDQDEHGSTIISEWTGSKRYDQIKRAAENRNLRGKFATHSSGRNIE